MAFALLKGTNPPLSDYGDYAIVKKTQSHAWKNKRKCLFHAGDCLFFSSEISLVFLALAQVPLRSSTALAKCTCVLFTMCQNSSRLNDNALFAHWGLHYIAHS